ncbi:MAG: GxxExxY protein [Acidobacteriota bacterium]|nr:GxxExxY protein [Acidobacteriota bacterium]
MPIICRHPLTLLSYEEFGNRSYDLVGAVLEIRKELGRFFDEKHYKRALALRRSDVTLEVPVSVSYQTFEKTYFLDVLLASGAIIEFKATDSLTSSHKAQLIHYQMLTGLKYGMLINVRPEKVFAEYVNCLLSHHERFRFRIVTSDWDESIPDAQLFGNILTQILADWGSCLGLALYEGALTHFFGGEENVLRPVTVHFDGVELGQQRLRLASERVAFKLTAFESTDAQERFVHHAKRLIAHTEIDALLWANLGRHEITLRSLKAGRKMGAKKT